MSNVVISEKRAILIANVLSIAIPVIVAILLGIRTKLDLGVWTKILPHVIGTINTLTTAILIFGLVAQKTGKVGLHRLAMTTAFLLGAIFLGVLCNLSLVEFLDEIRWKWTDAFFLLFRSHLAHRSISSCSTLSSSSLSFRTDESNCPASSSCQIRFPHLAIRFDNGCHCLPNDFALLLQCIVPLLACKQC